MTGPVLLLSSFHSFSMSSRASGNEKAREINKIPHSTLLFINLKSIANLKRKLLSSA